DGAARQREQLGGEGWGASSVDVEAPGGAAAVVRRARQRGHAGVVAHPAVVDRCAGHIANAPARGAPARLPLLLVASVHEALVEAADTLDRTAAQRHVRAPDDGGVEVVGA